MGLIHRIANFTGGNKWSSEKRYIKDRQKEPEEVEEKNLYEEIFEDKGNINYKFSTTEYWLLNRHII